MGKVRLKLPSWIASMLNTQVSDSLTLELEKEIGEGTTIGDLLAEFAFNYTDFRKVVFNPDTRKVSDQVIVILNENLVQFSDVAEAKLNDGDTVTFLSVYSGG